MFADANALLGEGRQGLVDLLPLHREQGHLGVEHESALLHAAGQPLPPPDDLLERKGDLLPGLVLDDVGDLAGLDGGQLDELRESQVPRHRHRHGVPAQIMAGGELLDGGADDLDRIGLRLREHHRVFDVLERLGDQLPWLRTGTAAQRLQRALADVDSPA